MNHKNIKQKEMNPVGIKHADVSIKNMNQKGMTLLELIISMAISLIVVMMIISFISGALRVFKKTNNEVNLQMEAQTSINQLANILMEAKGITQSSTDTRYLIDNVDELGYADSVLIFDSTQNKLYYKENVTKDDYESVTPIPEEQLLAEYVDEFKISSVGTDGIVTITMKLAIGEGAEQETYEIAKRVKLRNYSSP